MEVQLEAFGTRHPTKDGYELVFGPGLIDGTAEIRVVHQDPDVLLPTDVLALDYFVVDDEGRRWKTTSTFTAGVPRPWRCCC